MTWVFFDDGDAMAIATVLGWSLDKMDATREMYEHCK